MRKSIKTIAYLGPEGTFSHQAVLRYFSDLKSMPGYDLSSIFDLVAGGRAHFGLAPYENSQTGLIQNSFDYLLGSGVRILGRYDMSVEHCLLSRSKIQNIRVIYSHPQAIQQCRQWIKKRAAHCELHIIESSTELAKDIRMSRDSALIASREASEIYGLPIQASGIQTSINNTTRFWLIGRPSFFKPDLAHDSVTVYFTIAHKPGSLLRVLQQFQYQQINITHLHSHPVSGTPWHYGFFINAACSASDPHFLEVQDATSRLVTDWRLLGSYQSIGSLEAVRQRWWAVDRLSNQFQPNKKILYFYLNHSSVSDFMKWREKEDMTYVPLVQQLAELRLLASISVGKTKWRLNRNIVDKKREQEVLRRYYLSNKNKRDREWFRKIIIESKKVQKKVISSLHKNSIPAEEIVDMSIGDLRYHINQIDQWIAFYRKNFANISKNV